MRSTQNHPKILGVVAMALLLIMTIMLADVVVAPVSIKETRQVIAQPGDSILGIVTKSCQQARQQHGFRSVTISPLCESKVKYIDNIHPGDVVILHIGQGVIVDRLFNRATVDVEFHSQP